jgi:hypothetical protein
MGIQVFNVKELQFRHKLININKFMWMLCKDEPCVVSEEILVDNYKKRNMFSIRHLILRKKIDKKVYKWPCFKIARCCS